MEKGLPMEDELKPCPFCGQTASITFSGKEYTDGTWNGYIIAKCETCGAASKGGYYRGPEIEIPLEETVGAEKTTRAWNRRVKEIVYCSDCEHASPPDKNCMLLCCRNPNYPVKVKYDDFCSFGKEY